MGLIKDGELLRAAVALFGNNERISAAWTQCLLRVARFQGVNRTEFLDNRQFRGNVFTLLTQAERFIQEHLPIAGRIVQSSFVREDEPLYPPLALREALANAFCHRDYTSGGGSVSVGIYDDRLEITSTGPLHFGLTPGDAIPSSRATALESSSCQRVLPTRHYRTMGSWDDQDGRTDRRSRVYPVLRLRTTSIP